MYNHKYSFYIGTEMFTKAEVHRIIQKVFPNYTLLTGSGNSGYGILNTYILIILSNYKADYKAILRYFEKQFVQKEIILTREDIITITHDYEEL